MTKANLVVDTLVKRADGQYRIIVSRKGELVAADLNGKFERLKWWNDDLTSKDDNTHDIVEVWSIPAMSTSSFVVTTSYRSLLWKRPEIKKVTMADIERMFGCKVEVINH